MPHKHFPLFILREIEKHYPTLRDLVKENADILSLEEGPDWELTIKDEEAGSDFHFIVSNIRPHTDSSQLVLTDLTMNPPSAQKIGAAKSNPFIHHLRNQLIGWINIVREYNNLKLTADDSIYNYYHNYYSSNITNNDDDADTAPFELEKQIIIIVFLDAAIETIQKSPVLNTDLIEEATLIRDTVQSNTKSKVVKQLGKLFAKIHKKSVPLLLEVFKEAKKKLLEKAVNFGLEKLTEIVQNAYHQIG